MMRKVDEVEFISQLIDMHTIIVLRNEQGAAELNGDDFFVSVSDQWLTIYHKNIDRKESRSHIHLRRGQYIYAEVTEDAEYTPFIAFWTQKDKSDAMGADKHCSFAIYFPPFYSWHKNRKTVIAENQQFYQAWVTQYGRQFEIIRGPLSPRNN